MKVLMRERDLSDRYIRFARQVGADGFDIHNPENVPGFKEQGYPELVATTWFSISAPARLPRDIAEKLAPIPRLFFYHCRDDDVVPFAHLALHRTRLPRAVTRAVDSGGHQFRNDLTGVATDIRGDDVA